jgi:chromosome segregation ATPase
MGGKSMSDETSIDEGMVGRKLPRDVEMIVAAFMPNLKHLESRFDRIDLDIKELSIGVKDTNNRLNALEKRLDYFEVQVDKRFDLLSGELKDFKGDVYRRFDVLDRDLKDFKSDVYRRFEQVDKRFEQVDKRFEQIDKRFENVDRRFDQIAASIERLGDKLDARDARQRSFTLRMFGIAISISFLGVLGVLVKTFGML